MLRKQPYDKTVDWWCLGAVLYEMMYGLVGSQKKKYSFSDDFFNGIFQWMGAKWLSGRVLDSVREAAGSSLTGVTAL